MTPARRKPLTDLEADRARLGIIGAKLALLDARSTGLVDADTLAAIDHERAELRAEAAELELLVPSDRPAERDRADLA